MDTENYGSQQPYRDYGYRSKYATVLQSAILDLVQRFTTKISFFP